MRQCARMFTGRIASGLARAAVQIPARGLSGSRGRGASWGLESRHDLRRTVQPPHTDQPVFGLVLFLRPSPVPRQAPVIRGAMRVLTTRMPRTPRRIGRTAAEAVPRGPSEFPPQPPRFTGFAKSVGLRGLRLSMNSASGTELAELLSPATPAGSPAAPAIVLPNPRPPAPRRPPPVDVRRPADPGPTDWADPPTPRR